MHSLPGQPVPLLGCPYEGNAFPISSLNFTVSHALTVHHCEGPGSLCSVVLCFSVPSPQFQEGCSEVPPKPALTQGEPA